MAKNEQSSVIVELYDLAFTGRKGGRYGRVVTTRSLNEDDLVNIAVSRGTELDATTLRASLGILNQLAIEQISNGATVKFGPGYFNLKVSGVFTGDNARWDPGIHSLNIHVTPVAEMRNSLKKTSVDVRGLSASGLVINSLVDAASGEENKRLTPGGGVHLRGRKMRIEGEDDGVGISLMNQSTGEVTRIARSSVMVNDPSVISFVVPPTLATGAYKLSLTTQFAATNTKLKEARTFLLDYVLNVV